MEKSDCLCQAYYSHLILVPYQLNHLQYHHGDSPRLLSPRHPVNQIFCSGTQYFQHNYNCFSLPTNTCINSHKAARKHHIPVCPTVTLYKKHNYTKVHCLKRNIKCELCKQKTPMEVTIHMLLQCALKSLMSTRLSNPTNLSCYFMYWLLHYHSYDKKFLNI